ncbi:hypothetical protein Q8A67_024845 [Cirrhinus molitorella]|uniref:Uncharacterized protein n=1 Tax=Cirrhinus molitorella TaxID=172907 RepID=A0AA88TC96_9TELE|nr:hypothetical protein Q8A67_024845 [Cirrhinus molitorella]
MYIPEKRPPNAPRASLMFFSPRNQRGTRRLFLMHLLASSSSAIRSISAALFSSLAVPPVFPGESQGLHGDLELSITLSKNETDSEGEDGWNLKYLRGQCRVFECGATFSGREM